MTPIQVKALVFAEFDQAQQKTGHAGRPWTSDERAGFGRRTMKVGITTEEQSRGWIKTPLHPRK